MKKMTVASIAGLAVLAPGCGKIIEAGTERVAEEVIESETGGNVDINSDDGTFTITGEDGERIEINANEDGASMEITGEDGETIEFNADEEDGSVEVTGEDGQLFVSGGDLVDGWPSEYPIPGGVTIVQSSRIQDGESTTFVTAFEATDDFDSIVDDFKDWTGGAQPNTEINSTNDGQRSVITGYELDSGVVLTLILSEDGDKISGSVSVSNYSG